MGLFGEVWLWSLAGFLVGALLCWALVARPARRRAIELEESLADARRRKPSPEDAAPATLLPGFDRSDADRRDEGYADYLDAERSADSHGARAEQSFDSRPDHFYDSRHDSRPDSRGSFDSRAEDSPDELTAPPEIADEPASPPAVAPVETTQLMAAPPVASHEPVAAPPEVDWFPAGERFDASRLDASRLDADDRAEDQADRDDRADDRPGERADDRLGGRVEHRADEYRAGEYRVDEHRVDEHLVDDLSEDATNADDRDDDRPARGGTIFTQHTTPIPAELIRKIDEDGSLVDDLDDADSADDADGIDPHRGHFADALTPDDEEEWATSRGAHSLDEPEEPDEPRDPATRYLPAVATADPAENGHAPATRHESERRPDHEPTVYTPALGHRHDDEDQPEPDAAHGSPARQAETGHALPERPEHQAEPAPEPDLPKRRERQPEPTMYAPPAREPEADLPKRHERQPEPTMYAPPAREPEADLPKRHERRPEPAAYAPPAREAEPSMFEPATPVQPPARREPEPAVLAPSAPDSFNDEPDPVIPDPEAAPQLPGSLPKRVPKKPGDRFPFGVRTSTPAGPSVPSQAGSPTPSAPRQGSDDADRSRSLFEPIRPADEAASAAKAPVPAASKPRRGRAAQVSSGGVDTFVPPGPFGPGSAMPLPGGNSPSSEYRVKASVTALRYCSPESPKFDRTVAEVWFRSVADAERVGFRPLA